MVWSPKLDAGALMPASLEGLVSSREKLQRVCVGLEPAAIQKAR